jgi:hypothetical protein
LERSAISVEDIDVERIFADVPHSSEASSELAAAKAA